MISGGHLNPEDKNKADFFNSLTSATSPVVDANSLDFTPEELNKLIAILQKKQNITELNLNFNELGDSLVGAIITLAQTNPKLETIRCQYNNITDDGVEKLIRAAAEGNPRILKMHIDLACNKITDNSLNHISKFSPVTILSAVSGNYMKNFSEIENLQKQAQERYKYAQEQQVSNQASSSQKFFSEPKKNQPTLNEEDKLRAIQMQILELSPTTIQKLMSFLDQNYKSFKI